MYILLLKITFNAGSWESIIGIMMKIPMKKIHKLENRIEELEKKNRKFLIIGVIISCNIIRIIIWNYVMNILAHFFNAFAIF